MRIRKAETKDSKIIQKLVNNTGEFKVSENTVAFWPDEILVDMINGKDCLIMVVEAEEILVGFSIVNINKTMKKAIIENVFIDRNFRKKGIAGRLLQEVITVLKSKDIEYISTLVESNSPAQSLYEKNGFFKGKEFIWLDKVIAGDVYLNN